MTPVVIVAAALIPYALLLLGLGLTIVTDLYISRFNKRIMILILTLTASLIVQNAAEYLLAFGTPHIGIRTLVGIYGYAVRPAIIILFYYFVSRSKKIKFAWALTGRIISVENTPLDFRKEQAIGDRFNDGYTQFRICTGYDHNMILDGKDGEFKPIGEVKSEKTGICLEALTTEPAVHFYSGNFMHFDAAKNGKNGIRYPKNGGLCLEAQHYPDSVNHPQFPSTVLRPGEVYRQKTVYKFSVRTPRSL